MVYCQDCGASNNPANTDCRICEHRLERTPSLMPCAKCAARLGEGALFCSACGTPVAVLSRALVGSTADRQLARGSDGRESRASSGQPGNARLGRVDNGQHAASRQRATSVGSRGDAGTFDITSLVSEDDLPAWLRQAIQIEEADAAKRHREETAQAEAQAAEAARTARHEEELAARQAAAEVEQREAAALPAVDAPPTVETALGTGDGTTTASASAVAPETATKKSRGPRRSRQVQPAKPAMPKETRAKRSAPPRSYPWEGHGDKVVLIASLLLIILAILLLASGLLG